MSCQIFPVPLKPGDMIRCDMCFDAIVGVEEEIISAYFILTSDWGLSCKKCLDDDIMCQAIQISCVDCKLTETR